jgi:hypothetical protein
VSTVEQQADEDTGFRGESPERQAARKRVQAKRDFASHLVAYVVVNAMLIGVWALTGGGYFWPAWVLAGWGAGLVLHAWDAFWRRPVTEADVDAELRRNP